LESPPVGGEAFLGDNIELRLRRGQGAMPWCRLNSPVSIVSGINFPSVIGDVMHLETHAGSGCILVRPTPPRTSITNLPLSEEKQVQPQQPNAKNRYATLRSFLVQKRKRRMVQIRIVSRWSLGMYALLPMGPGSFGKFPQISRRVKRRIVSFDFHGFAPARCWYTSISPERAACTDQSSAAQHEHNACAGQRDRGRGDLQPDLAEAESVLRR
jgi:hypothetical protein